MSRNSAYHNTLQIKSDHQVPVTRISSYFFLSVRIHEKDITHLIVTGEEFGTMMLDMLSPESDDAQACIG